MALLVSGCAVGRPAGFVARSNDTCTQAARTVADLAAPRTAALAYALDRYAAFERAVSTLTDSSLPGGPRGQALRERWLRPARASLRAGDDALRRLHDAVRGHDHGAAARAFAAAATAGTAGVDVALLRSRGLTRCASLF